MPVAPGSRLGGTVTLQIWIAVSVYVLVAIKKRHGLSARLYDILQILSLTMFE